MIAFLLLTLSAPPTAYAKPELLIDSATLKTDAAKYHKIDVRPEKTIAETGRVPGSVAIELAKWNKTMSDGKADEEYWKVALQLAGITPKLPTVVVGSDMREVCRAWWLLKYAGVKEVKILNGGFEDYVKEKGTLSKEAPVFKSIAHNWKLDKERLSTKDDLKLRVEDKLSQIIDNRSDGEYSGKQAMAKKGGHVPTSTHLEWTQFLDSKSGKFKTPAEMAELIASKKIDLNQPCTTYCQSGGRASVAAFSLELMGAKNVKNYYKSWSEWGNASDTKVEKE